MRSGARQSEPRFAIGAFCIPQAAQPKDEYYLEFRLLQCVTKPDNVGVAIHRRSSLKSSDCTLPPPDAHGVQHLHIFGVGIVVRESVVELAVKRHDLAADRCQHLRRERAGSAVAAGAHHLEAALEFWAAGEISDVAGGKILVEFIGTTAAR